jgi:hypothetical protein
MKAAVKRSVFWAPRVLGILFVAFTSLFALDVFGGAYGLWGTIVALALHLIPTGIIVLLLLVAWRWEWVGAAAFGMLGILYICWGWGRFHWYAYLGISGPLFLIGILFLVSWIYHSELRAS